jgi:hypothetical protein
MAVAAATPFRTATVRERSSGARRSANAAGEREMTAPSRSRCGRRGLALAILLVFVGLWAQSALAGEPGDYLVSEGGHPYRVRFDPESRIHLGVAGALSIDGPSGTIGHEQAFSIDAGVSYRALLRSGTGRDQVVWQMDHHFAYGYVDPLSTAGGRPPAMGAALYGIFALRHDEVPSITVPSSPPIAIPFPFDVGFEAEAGRVSIPERFPLLRSDGAQIPVVRVGVMRAALILDPWRSGKPGRSFEIGIGARYDLDAYANPKLDSPRVLHRVAPMTATSLRFRLQSDDGLAVLDLRGDVTPHWTSEGVWKVMAASSLHLSRTLLALNDQPISAFFDGGYRFTPGSAAVSPEHEIRVSLGVAFALSLQ